MECSKNTIHKLISELFCSITDLWTVLSFNEFLNGFHDHLSESLILIFQSEMDSLNNFSNSNFNTDFSGCFNQLFVISFFGCHSSGPETPEVIVKNLFSDVSRLNSIATDNLFENFQNYFSHFLLWGLKLSY